MIKRKLKRNKSKLTHYELKRHTYGSPTHVVVINVLVESVFAHGLIKDSIFINYHAMFHTVHQKQKHQQQQQRPNENQTLIVFTYVLRCCNYSKE